MHDEDIKDENLSNDESSFAKPPSHQASDGQRALEDKLAELEKQCDEYLNNWKRSSADFINYKKEEMERIGILAKYAKEDTFLKILPILDSIYLLQKHTNKLEFVSMSEGIAQIEKQIEEFLKKEGIEEIETVGKPFNPNTMEAIDEETGENGQETGTVIEELQKGYKIEDKVLRPTKVRITK